MCDFVCETMSHAKWYFHWSVLYYQMILEVTMGGGGELEA